MECFLTRSVSRFALVLFSLLLAAWTVPVAAQPVIDGTASVSDGYTSIFVQNTNTQFGNATNGDIVDGGGGSELDQIFAKIENGRLYMVLAGNLQNNFNKMQVFFDTDPNAGVNQIISNPDNPGFSTTGINDPNSNVPYGLDQFCCGGFPPPDGGNANNQGALQKFDFFTFDPGFTADYTVNFSHGGENVGGSGSTNIQFYAMNAHYADLTQGVDGEVVSAGIALAPLGLPNVLRSPLGGDFNTDGFVNGTDFLIWQQNRDQFNPDPNNLGDPNNPGAMRSQGDANDDGFVNGADLAIWQSDYSNKPPLTGDPFVPNASITSTETLIGPALPGLSQGQLIDKVYAMDPNGGGCTDAAGTGCVVRELEFVLPVEAAGNPNNHRNFENTVDLQAAINNSNTAGVDGNDPNGDGMWNATGNPGDVTTGIEFSIPLSEIGDPNSGTNIKMTVLINGTGFDFASNQWSGGVLQGNLGGDGNGNFTGFLSDIDLGTIAGDQFVTFAVPLSAAVAAVPEPSTVALLLLGAGCAGFRRRRS